MEEMKDTQRFLAQQLLDHKKEIDEHKENAMHSYAASDTCVQEFLTSEMVFESSCLFVFAVAA